jgi:hypothetical protein
MPRDDAFEVMIDGNGQRQTIRFLEGCLELIETQPGEGDKKLQAAIATVLQFIDGGWGGHKWKSLADKHKHYEGNNTGGEHGRTD